MKFITASAEEALVLMAAELDILRNQSEKIMEENKVILSIVSETKRKLVK